MNDKLQIKILISQLRQMLCYLFIQGVRGSHSHPCVVKRRYVIWTVAIVSSFLCQVLFSHFIIFTLY